MGRVHPWAGSGRIGRKGASEQDSFPFSVAGRLTFISPKSTLSRHEAPPPAASGRRRHRRCGSDPRTTRPRTPAHDAPGPRVLEQVPMRASLTDLHAETMRGAGLCGRETRKPWGMVGGASSLPWVTGLPLHSQTKPTVSQGCRDTPGAPHSCAGQSLRLCRRLC